MHSHAKFKATVKEKKTCYVCLCEITFILLVFTLKVVKNFSDYRVHAGAKPGNFIVSFKSN